MTRMTWDGFGTHTFEAGVDRGVLFTPAGEKSLGVPWSGLIAISDDTEESSSPFFLDGKKYLDVNVAGDFRGSLRSFGYPDEFEPFSGLGAVGGGLFADDQPPKQFHLSYRTKLGNDAGGINLGYKVHIIWNLVATPQAIMHQSIGDTPNLVEFAWDLVATPTYMFGFAPTAHLTLDSTKLDPTLLTFFENALYGTAGTASSIPSLQDFITRAGLGVVVDNGDGTWTATVPDSQVNMISGTQFEITTPYSIDVNDDVQLFETTDF
ncbi:MAG TPA: hypothetical protein PKD12_08190 [Nitrospira sp.]|nr:hypothetical protein [Nitrospira sp.]